MIKEIGELLGWMIVISYGLTILNFIVKVVNKKYSKQINKSQNVRKYYNLFMKFIVKNHKLFGLLTIIFILSHFFIQFSSKGINITGGIAASIMFTQVLLGVYGAYVSKKRAGTWFIIHKIIAVILVIAILIHII